MSDVESYPGPPVEVCQLCCDRHINASLDCCDHTYCDMCILKWFETNSNCPVCRKDAEKLTIKNDGESIEIDVEQRKPEPESDEEASLAEARRIVRHDRVRDLVSSYLRDLEDSLPPLRYGYFQDGFVVDSGDDEEYGPIDTEELESLGSDTELDDETDEPADTEEEAEEEPEPLPPDGEEEEEEEADEVEDEGPIGTRLPMRQCRNRPMLRPEKVTFSFN